MRGVQDFDDEQVSDDETMDEIIGRTADLLLDQIEMLLDDDEEFRLLRAQTPEGRAEEFEDRLRDELVDRISQWSYRGDGDNDEGEGVTT